MMKTQCCNTIMTDIVQVKDNAASAEEVKKETGPFHLVTWIIFMSYLTR